MPNRNKLQRFRLASLYIVCLIAFATTLAAQDRTAPLLIGTKEAPPFAMKSANGGWEGMSIDLLDQVFDELGVSYELREVDLEEMLVGVAEGRLDASIAAMTITSDREAVIDFSHPFYHTGLGVAVPSTTHAGWRAVFDAVTSSAFLGTIGLLVILLVAVGGLIWLLERKRNTAHFETEPRQGLFSGFWWAAVTMTTVGYGDKAPITVLGRALAVVWMFSALILTAVFTAQLTSVLTTTSIHGPVQSKSDLSRVRVGNLSGSASLDFLRAMGVRPVGFENVAAGLEALSDRRIDAFVHDAPILKWDAGAMPGVRVTSLQFAPQEYGIILPPNNPIREQVNIGLLEVLSSRAWLDIQRRYLGD